MPNWSSSMLAGTFLMRPSGEMNMPFFDIGLLVVLFGLLAFVFVVLFVLVLLLLVVFTEFWFVDALAGLPAAEMFEFELELIWLRLVPDADKFVFDKLFDGFWVRLVSLAFCKEYTKIKEHRFKSRQQKLELNRIVKLLISNLFRYRFR